MIIDGEACPGAISILIIFLQEGEVTRKKTKNNQELIWKFRKTARRITNIDGATKS